METPIAEIVKPQVENNPSTTTDELGKDNFEEMVKKYKSEISNMEKNIVSANELKEMDKGRYEIEKQIWDLHLQDDNVEFLEPKTKLQTKPEYWELQKKLLKYDYDLQKKDREGRIASHDKGIENMQKNIDSIKKKLLEMGVEDE